MDEHNYCCPIQSHLILQGNITAQSMVKNVYNYFVEFPERFSVNISPVEVSFFTFGE